LSLEHVLQFFLATFNRPFLGSSLNHNNFIWIHVNSREILIYISKNHVNAHQIFFYSSKKRLKKMRKKRKIHAFSIVFILGKHIIFIFMKKMWTNYGDTTDCPSPKQSIIFLTYQSYQHPANTPQVPSPLFQNTTPILFASKISICARTR